MATCPPAERAPTGPLLAHLRQRLIPLALTCGLLAALAPPLLVGATGWQERRAQAALLAQQSASLAAEQAARDPLLWTYRLPKVLREPLTPEATLQVLDCAGRQVYPWPTPEHDASTHAPAQRHSPRWRVTQRWPIQLADARRGQVVVHISASALMKRLLQIGLLSALLGLGLGLLILQVPMRAVRLQGQRLALAQRELEQTQRELERANATLRQRVAQAVEELRLLSAAHLNAQDDERARIARELHDGLGQNLSALGLRLERAQAEHGVWALSEARQLVEDTLRELRLIIDDLRPLALEGGSLAEVLRDMAERFELETGVATFFKHRGSSDCPEELAASLLRVFQEALHNVRRHAQATEVGVTLRLEDQRVELIVTDDGQGFDPSVAQAGAGHGLRNMRARARLLGGRCELTSAPGQGTTVCLSFERGPRDEREAGDQPPEAAHER